VSERILLSRLLIPLTIAEIACSMESNMIFVAISKLYQVFGDPMKVGWLVTAFTLMAAASAGIGGRLGDLFGCRRVLLIVMIIGLSGSLLSAITNDLNVILVGRVLQGTTTAALPLCFGILREHLAPREVSIGVGILSATFSLTAGLGAMVGGIIVDHFQWHGIFIASALVSALAVSAIWLIVPRSRIDADAPPADFRGSFVFVSAIAAFLFGVGMKSQGYSWKSAIMVMATGLALFAAWAMRELRIKHPLIDLRSLADRRIALANLAIFLTGAGPMMTSPAILPLLQQPLWTGAGFALSATQAGMLKLCSTIGSAGSVVVMAFALKRYSVRSLAITAAAIGTASWYLVATVMDNLTLLSIILVGALAAGAGMMAALVPLIIIENTHMNRTGEATGMSQVIRATGNAVGAQIVALSLSSAVVTRSHDAAVFPAASAYAILYVAIGTIALTSLATVFMLPRDSDRVRGSPDDIKRPPTE
jgi:MFS family permease